MRCPHERTAATDPAAAKELRCARELLAQLILTATLLPRRLWPRVQLPTPFGTKPLLVQLLLLFHFAARTVQLLLSGSLEGEVILRQLH